MNTLGDHLRKVRLDRGLSQPDVAKILNVTDTTITGWELNRNQPTAKFAKVIIDFLGYVPFAESETSLGKQLHYARLMIGKTQKQVAELIVCDASNLRQIETSNRKPQEELKRLLEDFISTALADLTTRFISST